MKKNDTLSTPMGVGVITIIMVLLVLALSIFSALTLTSARADLTLSQTNAATVSAYYDADARAAVLAADFMEGTALVLEETLPMTESQALYIHLERLADGTVRTLAWQTVPTDAANAATDTDGMSLPVLSGELG